MPTTKETWLEKSKKLQEPVPSEEINELPEAGASITFKVLSPQGYPALLTARDSHIASLFDTIEQVEAHLKESGWLPDRQMVVAKQLPLPTGDKCPKCGADMVRFASKDGTKSGVKCSTGKFDFVSKKTIGCDYVKWDDQDTSVGGGATPAQRGLLEAKGMWKDGLTKSQASELISNLLGK